MKKVILTLICLMITSNSWSQSSDDHISYGTNCLYTQQFPFYNILENDSNIVPGLPVVPVITHVNGLNFCNCPSQSWSDTIAVFGGMSSVYVTIAENGDLNVGSPDTFPNNMLDTLVFWYHTNLSLDSSKITIVLQNCETITPPLYITLNCTNYILSGPFDSTDIIGIGANVTDVQNTNNGYTFQAVAINTNNGTNILNFFTFANNMLISQSNPNPGYYYVEFYTLTDTIKITFFIQECFPIDSSSCFPTTVDVLTPSLRRCANATYNVSYSNLNANGLQNAYVDVQLDDNLTFIASAQAHQNLGAGLIRFDIGNVPAFYPHGAFSFDAYVNCDSTVLGETHCVKAEIFPHNVCGTAIDTDIVVLPIDTINNDSVFFRVFTTTGNIATNYRIYEDHLLGERGTVNIGTNPRTLSYRRNNTTSVYRMEVDAVSNSINVNTTPSANVFSDSIIDTTGIVIDFPLSDGAPWISISCRQNVDSYDPNSKEAYPAGYGPQHYIDQNVDLDYVINFQNEGTANALRIVVEDVIDADLDMTTFSPGASTHTYRIEKNGNSIKFIFDNINLVPKTINEAASMGAVKFSIRQKYNNAIGTQIDNTANIYFDFNTAIVTNTVKHVIGKPNTYSDLVSIKEIITATALSIYPNPSNTLVNFETLDRTDIYELDLLDLSGRSVVKQSINNSKATVDVSQLQQGIYIYTLKTKKGLNTGKIVVR